jgi:UDPglucose 6-dehydrogenase
MKIAVAGLWHLGTVTAACMASVGHDVIGIDRDAPVVEGLRGGRLPVAEPGLAELVEEQVRAGRLRFTSDFEAAAGRELIWIAYDTPVNENDLADVEFVVEQTNALLAHASPGALVLVSSQLPVGATSRLEWDHRHRGLRFACSPENLRLGKAIEAFTRPDRVVLGVRSDAERSCLAELFRPFTRNIEWMKVESAEMTKHALNAFLATSVVFINEIAELCARVGADAHEVARGLKSDSRIGPGAYLRPGAAFAGGTLARDVSFLLDAAANRGVSLPLMGGVRESNEQHKGWVQRELIGALGDVAGKTICVLGLTYKPGTNTLRRSGAIEICLWLHSRGAVVRAHDPAISSLPEGLEQMIELRASPAEAIEDADAALVATEWPEFRSLTVDDVVSRMRRAVVLDPGKHLEAALSRDPRVQYHAVGKAS